MRGTADGYGGGCGARVLVVGVVGCGAGMYGLILGLVVGVCRFLQNAAAHVYLAWRCRSGDGLYSTPLPTCVWVLQLMRRWAAAVKHIHVVVGVALLFWLLWPACAAAGVGWWAAAARHVLAGMRRPAGRLCVAKGLSSEHVCPAGLPAIHGLCSCEVPA